MLIGPSGPGLAAPSQTLMSPVSNLQLPDGLWSARPERSGATFRPEARPPLGFFDVTLAGLARDGGLYVPESWPFFPPDRIGGLPISIGGADGDLA